MVANWRRLPPAPGEVDEEGGDDPDVPEEAHHTERGVEGHDADLKMTTSSHILPIQRAGPTSVRSEKFVGLSAEQYGAEKAELPM